MNDENSDTCEHYEDHVGLRVFPDFDGDAPCSWCGAEATLAITKSERHEIAFCDECRDVIRILASDSND